MFIESFKVDSPNVKYTEGEINSVYNYETTELVHENRDGTYQWIVKPKSVKYEFKTDARVPKLGFASMPIKENLRKNKWKNRILLINLWNYFVGIAYICVLCIFVHVGLFWSWV